VIPRTLQSPLSKAERPVPSAETLIDLYGRMSLIRQFEERLKWLVETGVPVGAVHYYIGQEAVASGICAAIGPDDWIASTHRGHGHCIAKGADVSRMVAELFGKVTGTNRGKGGSMHITDITKGDPPSALIRPWARAWPTPLALGFPRRYAAPKQVAVGFFGDGAASIGTLHECMTLLASLRAS
jgi:pyruvate dehydrogenase E1 component alpha subunit